MRSKIKWMGLFGVLILIANGAFATPIYNPTSSFSHTIDGYFTPSNEWSDITPHDLAWSHVYFDYDGDHLYIMNDWVVNNADHPDGGIFEDDYNQFIFESEYAKWELRIYWNGTIGLWEWDSNGDRVEKTDTSDVDAAYGWGASPNSAVDHAMWEVQLDVNEPGTNSYEIDWNAYHNMLIVIRDPHPDVPAKQNLKKRIKADALARAGFKAHLQNNPATGQTGVETEPEIPEPATSAVIASGLAGLAWLKRRRSNK